ncbi:putative late blight resistance protein homolog R1A-3 [Coffea arabica]|uniref:Late blight resistance protein homolog R1A-3 n=1 Tax=Coffea arabica TaxID=13443 RepID=A0A6P6TFR0_COFAR
MFKLLRVLDLGKLCLGSYFPREVVLLVHLRYLTIQCYINSIPSSIANLSRLETFIIKVYDGNVGLPDTIRSMKKLRHLYVEGILSPVAFSLSSDDLEVSQDIYHFETFTLAVDPSPQIFQKTLTKLPSIRRLKCVGGRRYSAESFDGIIKLDFLSQLESLKVVSFQRVEFAFPLNLRKLTLSILDGPGLLARFEQNKLPWNKISAIAELPNLEVLKLSGAFVGETWEMGEGAFPKLRFLKLAYLDIVRWTASCDDFPPLQKLVLEGCSKLEEVPSCLGDIPTIEVIEVKWCHKSTASLVKQIQEQQMDMGNECLKIFIQENFKIWAIS